MTQKLGFEDRGRKFAFFLIGVAVPVAGYLAWSKLTQCRKKEHVDEMHDMTVEDSFPASDPPSAY